MMSMDAIRCFISYSHKDEGLVKDLIKCLNPLIENGLITIWYDRRILPSQGWNEEIEAHIDGADLMVYAVSLDFCSSDACKHELIRGLKRRNELKTDVLPVILKNCGWKDIKIISEMQAVPHDGKAVVSFSDISEGFMEVYSAIKKMAEEIRRRKMLDFTESTKHFFDEIGSLAALNFSGKNDISFAELFVYPDLMDQSSVLNSREIVSGRDLARRVMDQNKVLISGESQSGKTAICKKLMYDLRAMGLCPILFTGRDAYDGNMERKIRDTIKKQYTDPECVRSALVVPVLDDFHLARDKDSVLKSFESYDRVILVVDDVYNLDLSNGARLNEFHSYMLEPMSAVKRGDLIANWVKIQNRLEGITDDNFEHYDRLTRDVDQTLGKALGKGVVPSYPFYILSILATVDATGKPLDSEITSQGHCYQVLLILSLNKAGVKGSMLDSYVNYLTELGYWHFKNGDSIDDRMFNDFSKAYRSKFVLAIEDRDILKKLTQAGIYRKNGFGCYAFAQRYLKYYFASRYISENFDECKEDYQRIIENLGNSSNSYIAVFMAHHSKNLEHLKAVRAVVDRQFSSLAPCFLRKDDTDFLNQKAKCLATVAFPDPQRTPTMERRAILEQSDMRREMKEDIDTNEGQGIRELITAIRGTEVVGQIVKCRAGSLCRQDIDELLSSIIMAHGRLLASFVNILKDESAQTEVVDWIVTMLKDKIKERGISELRSMSEQIFWRINYFTIHGIIMRCIYTVGSDKLVDEVARICEECSSPLTDLIPIGVKLWFKKHVDVEAISKQYRDTPDEVLRWILQRMVARYCGTHKIPYRDRQFLAERLELKKS